MNFEIQVDEIILPQLADRILSIDWGSMSYSSSLLSDNGRKKLNFICCEMNEGPSKYTLQGISTSCLNQTCYYIFYRICIFR